MQETKKNPIGIGWIIAAFFFLLPPLGVLLIGLRLRFDRAKVLKNGQTMVKLAIGFAAIFFTFFVASEGDSVSIMLSFYFGGAGSIIALVMAQFMLRRGMRDKKIRAAVDGREKITVVAISEAIGEPVADVTKTLQTLIDCGVFPNAELHLGDGMFITNKYYSLAKAEAAAEAEAAKPTQTLRCSGCGATVMAVVGKGGRCEYCGAPVNFA